MIGVIVEQIELNLNLFRYPVSFLQTLGSLNKPVRRYVYRYAFYLLYSICFILPVPLDVQEKQWSCSITNLSRLQTL